MSGIMKQKRSDGAKVLDDTTLDWRGIKLDVSGVHDNADMRCPLRVYFDGASRSNPGQAGCGAVMFFKCEVCGAWNFDRVYGAPVGNATSNFAEYFGLITGLRAASDAAPGEEIDVIGDSELVVKQMRGEYRVQDPMLKVLHNIAKGLTQHFARVNFWHRPRSENAVADKIAGFFAAIPYSAFKKSYNIYYPHLSRHAKVICNDKHAVASHDLGTFSAGKNFIDATFLKQNYGASVLCTLEWDVKEDFQGACIIGGKNFHRVILGRTQPLRISLVPADGESPVTSWQRFYVVNALPVPVFLTCSELQRTHSDYYRFLDHPGGVDVMLNSMADRYKWHPYYLDDQPFIHDMYIS